MEKKYLLEIDQQENSNQSEKIKSELEIADFEVPSVTQTKDGKYIVKLRQIGNTDESEDIKYELGLAVYDVISVEQVA